MSKFSDTLIYLRKRAGISQQELADKISVSRSLIGMYEAGQRMPSVEVLEAIADTFNVNIDFLVGHVDLGEYSRTFRNNLARIMEDSNQTDINSTGIDVYEVNLIIAGAIPLTFDCACQLAEQLGETLDSMLGKEKPTPVSEDGLDDLDKLLIKHLLDLTPDAKRMILAQMQVMRESQQEPLPSSVRE